MRRGAEGGGSGAGRGGRDGRDGHGYDGRDSRDPHDAHDSEYADYDGPAYASRYAAHDDAGYDPDYDAAYDADYDGYDDASEAGHAYAGAHDADYDEYEDYDDEDEDEYDERPGRAAGPSSGAAPVLTNRVFTIPNLISLARLAGVPLFLGLILSPYYGGPKYDNWALVVLMLSGFSDWLDGKLARRWNQMTRLGALLDPLADRLYIFATLVGLTMRGIIPLWLVIVLVGRDVALLVGIVPRLRRAGYGTTLPVHFLGKAATFNLLYAFPLLLIGQSHNHALANVGNIFGWAFAGWGAALYVWAAVLYFVQLRELTAAPQSR